MTPLDTSDFSRRPSAELREVIESATRVLAERASAGEAGPVKSFEGDDATNAARAAGLVGLSVSTITRAAQEGASWARQPGGPGSAWIISKSLLLATFGRRAS
jgi:hypothetical protein